MADKTRLVDCKFIPKTADLENSRRVECVVKCNPFEIEVLHGCDRCGFNPDVAAMRTANGKLVKGKDGLMRLTW